MYTVPGFHSLAVGAVHSWGHTELRLESRFFAAKLDALLSIVSTARELRVDGL